MKNIIVGTAGHIDHGKTTLIKALTGRNTDRWEEEQRRGITIDLGFTYFDLKNGDRVGIIDVPGHEKFINNMVAGVVGMDLVLLVVAADEGIMPQTREHMDILGLLGIKKSILVINKCDLVDEEWLELVEEEIQEELEGTFLEGAPVVKVSAATGQGLDELTDTIQQLMSDEVVAKDTQTIPRLPIDRAFTLSGFGTIITGTLISGTITREDVLEMYPIGKECKIRNIQVHGQNQDKCYAGQRVAINLSNVKKKEIRRGCVLAPKNSMKNTDLLDVKLKVLEDSMRILTNHERLHLYTGTSEILCRAVLLDKEQIGPGEEGLVQLRLEEEIAVKRGDRFVVRFYSPMETIGGGIVLEPNPVRKKRFDAQAIEELKKKRIVFVAGGVGTAPVYPQLKWLHEHGITADAIVGAKTKDLVILEKEMSAVSNLYITTDDGSYVRKGMGTDVLRDLVQNQGKQYDVCVAIGPMIMMKFVCLLTKELNIPTVVSMNPIMVDGTGMCGACRLMVGNEVKFACVDGPEFDGHLVDFDLAMKRQQMYKTEEGRAMLALTEGDTHHGGCGHCN